MSRKQTVNAQIRRAVWDALEGKPGLVRSERYRGAPIAPYIRPTPAQASWPVTAVICVEEPFDPSDPTASVVCFTKRVVIRRATSIDKPWERKMPDRYESTGDDDDPGLWTMEQVRARFIDAIQAMRRMRRDAHTVPSERVTAALSVINDAMEAYGWEAAEASQPMPTADELRWMDRVLPDWLLLVDGDDAVSERKAMIGVGLQLNLRAIGRDLGCSHETARQLQKRGFTRVAERLNAGVKTASLDLTKAPGWAMETL